MRKIAMLILIMCQAWQGFAQNTCDQKLYYPPTLNDSVGRVYTLNLKVAFSNYQKDSLDAENIIWYGRRSAYLGHYHFAIDIFTRGIQLYPNDPRFLRHRAHRYITVRCYYAAMRDLEKAVELIRGQPDQVEPDGIPNALNQPTSTLHTNIWYHLGLVYYLVGDYEHAVSAFEECLKISSNNDMRVATLNWLYVSMRKMQKHKEADKKLVAIHEDMQIIENRDYLELLLMYKKKDEKKIQEKTTRQETLSNATLGYGLGNYYLLKGDKEKAKEIFERVVNGNQWASFGFIAAQRELEELER